MMALKNTSSSFGTISKFFHWTIALLVIAQFAFIASRTWFVPKNSPSAQWLMADLHKPIGVLLLALVILAILWRLVSKRPVFPSHMNPLEKLAAFITHWLLSLGTLVMAASGLIMSIAGGYAVKFFNLFQIPFFINKNKALSAQAHEVHEILALGLGILILIHLLAVIKHQWIDKDRILQRMLPFH